MVGAVLLPGHHGSPVFPVAPYTIGHTWHTDRPALLTKACVRGRKVRREGGSVKRDVVMRGLRFGLVVGGGCALGWGALWTAGMMVALVLREWHDVPSALVSEVILVGGSLFVGAVLGLVLGATLALVPGWLTSHGLLRRLLAGVVAGTLFVGEVVVSVEGGILPVLVMLMAIPAVGVLAAACSGDIAGRSRRHAWLWPRTLLWADVRALTWRGRLRAVVDLLWN